MDHNQLDQMLRQHGWYYDNGWSHDSTHSDCYTSEDYGRSDPFFVILAKSNQGRILRLSKDATEKSEIWSGPISTSQDVDQLLAFVDSQPRISI